MKYISLLFAIIFAMLGVILGLGYWEMAVGIIPTEIPIVIEGTLEYTDIRQQLFGQDIIGLLFTIICIALSSVLFSSYHRLKRKKKDTFDSNSIQGPFVLYLRSFVEDKTTRKQVSFNDIRSEEEVLVEVLSDIAPVYAIGDPRDKKMPIGASRIYVDEEHWKSTVKDMAQKSVAVALRLGKTDSFWWEVEMVLKNIPIEKILFIIPESNSFSNVAYLYKTLIDHNIDIKSPDISIEQKSSGSISSFLFFSNEAKPVTREVRAPRFTRLFISYETIIRNTLDAFRAKYGLNTTHRRTVSKARLLISLLVVYLTFIAGAKLFSDFVSLKYQMPYEFVEKCIIDTEYANTYSEEVDGANFISGIIEARKGVFALDNDEYKLMYLIEVRTLESMSEDEFLHLDDHPKNMLLLVKKYLPEYYETYIGLLANAAIMSTKNPESITDLIDSYKVMTNYLPSWVGDALYYDENYDNDFEYILKFNDIVQDHLSDHDITDILKALASQNFR